MRDQHKQPHKIFFETLGNKVRWEIVHLLRRRPLRATEIASSLGYGQSLVSHHLRRLEHCGFVRCTPNGRERIYALNRETIEPLLTLADAHIARFCRKLCCPKR